MTLRALAMVLAVASLLFVPWLIGQRGGSASARAECMAHEAAEHTRAEQALQQKLSAATSELRELRASHARQQLDAGRLEQQLSAKRASTRIVYRTIRQEVPHAIKTVGEKGAECAFKPVFGPDFVRLWDHATDPARPPVVSCAAGVSPCEPARADSPESPFTSEERLLQNHIDNAELCTEAREQLTGLIEWHREHDGVVLP